MRINGKVVALSLISMALGATAVQAQERDETKMNQLSARPIDDNDILMKKTLWRRMDLKEKQNMPMFSVNNEITRYLIDAAKAGLIPAYTNDSCTTELTPEQLHKRLLFPDQAGGLSQEEIDAGFDKSPASDGGWGDAPKQEAAKKPATDDGWGTPVKETKKEEPVDDGWGTPVKKKATPKKGAKMAMAPAEAPKDTVKVPDPFDQQLTMAATEEEFFPKDITLLEVKEEWTFDKKRSRLYNDIQSITMILPASANEALGLEIPVASFKYKDVERLFRSEPKKYIWYNTQNTAQHKNLADAFDLQLPYGRITKYSNAMDQSFIDIYAGQRQGLIKSLQYEQDLLELESSMWEY